LIILFSVNLLLAVAEVAIVSQSKEELEDAHEGSKKAIQLAEIAQRPNFYLFSIRVVSICAWLLFGATMAHLLTRRIYQILTSVGNYGYVWLVLPAIALILILAAFVQLIIHEAAKARGLKNPQRVMMIILPALRLILMITRPVVAIINSIANANGINYDEKSATKEEIIQMVSQGGKHGSIDAADAEMINNIFEFDEKTAQDISQHRMNIIALEINASREEIISTILEHDFSRIPIYEETIDNIVGILHTKDLMNQVFAAKEVLWEIDLKDIMRNAYLVPTSTKTGKLLENMRQEKTHMAIVVDEYGGVTGLLTVEDLLEEIVGNIYDEHDDVDEPQIDRLGEDRYIIDGTTRLEEISESLEIELPIDDYDTIGGFVIGLLDRIPADGEQPSITFEGYTFQVYEAREKRIHSILVSKNPKEVSSEQAE